MSNNFNKVSGYKINVKIQYKCMQAFYRPKTKILKRDHGNTPIHNRLKKKKKKAGNKPNKQEEITF